MYHTLLKSLSLNIMNQKLNPKSKQTMIKHLMNAIILNLIVK